MVFVVLYCFSSRPGSTDTLRPLIIFGRANNEQGGGPGSGVAGPGGGFSGNRRSSGEPPLLLRLKTHPQDQQNRYQIHPPNRYQPTLRLLRALEQGMIRLTLAIIICSEFSSRGYVCFFFRIFQLFQSFWSSWRFKKSPEVNSKNFLPFSSKSNLMVRSSDQKTKKFMTIRIMTIKV